MASMNKLARFLACIVGLLLVGGVNFSGSHSVLAQSDEGCSAVASQVLEVVESVCQGLGRDQLCYGNVSIEATASADAASFTFEQQGDVVDLVDIETLRLRTLDYLSSEWGVALLKVQASLPDDSTENVTVVLFGNVEIGNEGQDIVNLPMRTRQGINVRLQASGDGALLGSLGSGVDVTANGRITNLNNEQWIRIEYKGAPGGYGWVLGAALSSEGDASSLSVLESSSARPFGPMQAFTFTSGTNDSPCGNAADSGIMIQTPEGQGEITFLINEVDFQIGSTAYFQAQPGDNMRVRTLDGEVEMSFDGVTRNIPSGAQSRVPLDENGQPSGPPTRPRPYRGDDVLPLEMFTDAEFFEEDIDIPDPFLEECLIQFNAEFNDDTPGEFGDEVSPYCVLEYYDVFFTEYEEGLDVSCFDPETGAIIDACLTDFVAEVPEICFDQTTGEYNEACLDEYLTNLPDTCFDEDGYLIAGCEDILLNLDETCFADASGQFVECYLTVVEALPDACFDESGQVSDTCFDVISALPDECVDPISGDVDDACYEGFLEELPDSCIDEESGEFFVECLALLDDLPGDCFDADGEIIDECYSDYVYGLDDECYDEITGEIDYLCLEGYFEDYGDYGDYGDDYGGDYGDDYGDYGDYGGDYGDYGDDYGA